MKLNFRMIFLISIFSFVAFCIQGYSQPPLQGKGPVYAETTVLVDRPAVTPADNVKTFIDSSYHGIDTKYRNALSRLKQQAATMAAYAKDKNYNTDYVFLVDMTLPSGKNRFFVYNLKKDAVEASSLVTHGIGCNPYENDDPLLFSNVPESRKTSIGKYKIGTSYNGKFGLAYKMYGLDSTNDRAFERDIVLHAHKRVPEKEVFPEYIIVSAGCPTVSPSFLNTLSTYLKPSRKPVLMWIYN